VSFYDTHLAQTLRYSNIVSIVSIALHLTFSFIQSSLVIICRFMYAWGAIYLVRWQLCRVMWNVACLPHHCHHFWNIPPMSSLCSHSHFGLHTLKHSLSTYECQWVQFSPYVEIQWHICFVRTFISDSFLPDCSSAAVCSRATKLINWWQEDSICTGIPLASTSNLMG
jgi:hypothetical protein